MVKSSLSHSSSKLPTVSLSRLRIHFKEGYNLNDEQVEKLIVSSSLSLQHAIVELELVINSERGGKAQQISALHSLKGVFLNMGESQWAAQVKDIESEITTGTTCDLDIIMAEIKKKLVTILSYEENERVRG